MIWGIIIIFKIFIVESFIEKGTHIIRITKRGIYFLKGTDTKCNALYTAWWYRYFPLINKDGFDLSINFTVDSVKIDFYKGIVKVKVKKNDVEFISESPAADIKEKIINNIISKEKGIYFVGYEYGGDYG